MLKITDTITIDENELEISAVRASGPGGQNVNKVATAVQLRFDAGNSPSLPADVKERLVPIAGNKMTKAGILIIEAQKYRTQQQNRQDALERLVELIRQAAKKPKSRRKTKASAASKQRRLDEKQRRSETKRRRQSISRTYDE